MDDYYAKKSTIDEIRARFDADVERFSNLTTGQISTVDAPLAMELISCAAAVSTNPIIYWILDAKRETIQLNCLNTLPM